MNHPLRLFMQICMCILKIPPEFFEGAHHSMIRQLGSNILLLNLDYLLILLLSVMVVSIVSATACGDGRCNGMCCELKLSLTVAYIRGPYFDLGRYPMTKKNKSSLGPSSHACVKRIIRYTIEKALLLGSFSIQSF